jgi:uncharacterized membrane protein (DUF485 family)
VLSTLAGNPAGPTIQEEKKVMATIAAWALVLFFLWYGLAAFVSALNTDMFKKIGAILALIYAVLSIVGMF